MAATNGAAAALPASGEYDLLPKLVGVLDRHLIFPLLQFSADQLEDDDGNSKDAARSREITRAKYELLKKTNMTDYVADLYCDIEGLENPPDEFAAKRQQVITRLEQAQQETAKLTELLGDDEVINNIRSDKVANLEYLKKEHGVSAAGISPYPPIPPPSGGAASGGSY